MDPTTGGLMAISLSDSEDSSSEKAVPRAKKHEQSEADFQAVQAAYTTKVENGEVHNKIRPIVEGTNKQHVQEVVHAIEELYYFHQYEEAAELAAKILRESRGLEDHGDVPRLIESYEKKCRAKAQAAQVKK